MTENPNDGALASTCATCTHSFRDNPDMPVMFCRAHPPMPLLTDISRDPSNSRSTGVNYWSVYPTVQEGWTCGEHKSRGAVARPSAKVVDLTPRVAKPEGAKPE